jgi:hypothetical protein
VVVEFADAALACRAVVRIPAVVGPPHEASDAEDAPVLARHVADGLERLAVGEFLGDDVGQREAVLGRALDRARVVPHQAEQAEDGGRRLCVDRKDPGALQHREVGLRVGIGLHRRDEEEYEEEHERVAARRLGAHLAEVLLGKRRQRGQVILDVRLATAAQRAALHVTIGARTIEERHVLRPPAVAALAEQSATARARSRNG